MFKKIYHFFHKYYHKHYHGLYAQAKKLFVFDLGLLALAFFMLAASMFFFFWKPGITDLVDLKISIGENRVRSGDLVKLTVDYTNRSKYNLLNISLGLRLPDGFIIDRARTPESVFSKNSIFAGLKELPAGAKGQTELYGRFWAVPDKEESVIADMSYEPEKMNRREQKLSALYATLPASVLEGRLDMASSSFPASQVPFKYELANRSDQTVDNISITSNWPESFIPENDAANISIPPGGVKVISGTVKMPDRGGQYDLQIIPAVNANNRNFPQIPSGQTVTVLTPQITIGAQITNNIAYAEPGATIPVQINWQNKSATPLQNLQIRISANRDGIVDWAGSALNNHAKYEKGSMIIDKSARTALSNGAAGAQDTFTVNLKLLSSFSLGLAEQAYLEIIPTMEAGVSGVSGQKFSQEGARARLPLATELRMSAETRYYTEAGDQLGRGPLPPRVDKTTKYWLFIKILNTSNEVNDAAFTATLPAGVELTGKQSVSIGPEVQFNAVSRMLSWSYNTLPANSQTGLYLEVAVTPTSAQLGQNILLLKDLKFTASDNFVGKTFRLSIPAISNVLNKNDRGSAQPSAVAP